MAVVRGTSWSSAERREHAPCGLNNAWGHEPRATGFNLTRRCQRDYHRPINRHQRRRDHVQ